MAILGFNAEDRFEAVSRGILDQFGIRLTVGYGFEEFKEIVAKTRPDHPLGDPFNPERHDMSKENACWIVGNDLDGDIVHLQALRVLPTKARSVAEYFRRTFHDFSPPEMDIDFERSRYRPGPGARRMVGRIVYSGETWLAPSDAFRGTGLSSILGKFAMLTAMREFNADYVLGFAAQPVAYKGFPLRMGFMHVEPMALRWYAKGNPKAMEGVMAYMSDEDMRFIMDLPDAELPSLAA